jgi:hypothetical protein
MSWKRPDAMHRRPREKYLDAGLKGWIVNTAKRNYWRVASYYELDDLISDGYLAYAVCKARYSKKVQNKAHFMALFKRVYWSRIVDLASDRSKTNGSVFALVIDGKERAWLPYAQAVTQARAATKAGKSASVVPGFAEVRVNDLYPMISQSSALEFLAGGELGEGEMRLKMEAASDEIKAFMDDYLGGYFNGRSNHKIEHGRETNNAFYNRLLKTSGVNYESELRGLLI